MSLIRVLIADDHAVVRDGLKLVLEAEEGFVVVGEAGDGAQAVSLAREFVPDVVLMDLRMRGLDGLSALEQIHRDAPNIALVILTTYNEDDLIARGLRAGARLFAQRHESSNVVRYPARGGARRCFVTAGNFKARIECGARSEK